MKTAVIGGDKRMLFAARAFADDGYDVAVAGFDDLISLCEIRVCGIGEAVSDADLIVLPVRPVADGCLNAPLKKEKTAIRDVIKQIGKKPVFTGCAEQIMPYAAGRVYDYATREDFTWRNAELTAEGALGILLRDYEGSVFGTNILITGWGRIGKCLSANLKALGARVTAAARKEADRAMIALSGMKAVDYPQIDYSDYQVIVNTVPAPVIDAAAINAMQGDVFLIDLASKPGGVDFQRAKERDLTCIHALSLPGKSAPLAAGTIIKDTIMNIVIREDVCPLG